MNAMLARRWIPLAAVLFIAAEWSFIAVVIARGAPASVMSVALAADVALAAGVALWLVRWEVRAKRPQLIRAALLAAVAFGVASHAAGVEPPIVPSRIIGGAEIAILAVAARALLKLRHAPAEDRWSTLERSLRDFVPGVAAAAIASELRLVASGAAYLLRRPVRVAEGTFTTTARSKSGFLVPTLAVLTIGEMAAMHALLASLAHAPAWAHAALVAGHAYLVLWLMGDRRAMEETGHRIRGNELVLELGMRFRARVPIAQIRSALVLHDEAERRSVRPSPTQKNPQATPLDAPNLHLCFSAPVRAITYFGIPRTVWHLDLFVDDPEGLLGALRAAARAGCSGDSANRTDTRPPAR